jgi:uncharacterized SAM-binding protein YcdF (DUF218 family)
MEPLGAIWLLMALGVCWLCWKRQWRSVFWLGLPTLLIFLVGSTPLSDTVVAQAERPYAPAGRLAAVSSQWPAADAVVALGGGFYPSDHDAFGIAMAGAGSRVLTAVELARLGKAKALVVGGSVPVPGRPGALTTALVQDWLQTWRVAGVAVTNLGVCADTHDEAVAFKRLKEQHGWQRVILVTSALHMPRAEAVFRKQGVPVVPVACDFQAHGVPPVAGFGSPFPRQDRFYRLALYLHEQIGWLVYRWRGWV